jgi:hypothetical protein
LTCNQSKSRLQYFALLSFAHVPASAKFANAFSTLVATIILIDFTRSWSVDGVQLILTAMSNEFHKKGAGLTEKWPGLWRE